ncbi:hypothetical protein MESS2_1030176 [Mesorhizobium metallidurans STM 2683]|uniref:Uncharacterized protein n=1 Tax=Mesorhizobium metallidurans STM 2683 TaxID=1297569 RepID=M5EF70_9HYPH|nr:SHOCT domain-containing protein [Mesorhizobium metallidurans]CCV03319.1 hypothetical protein MESS2_1030176 [Mesorhizobium metallidurans STM 2683]
MGHSVIDAIGNDPLAQLVAMRAKGEIDDREFNLARKYLQEELSRTSQPLAVGAGSAGQSQRNGGGVWKWSWQVYAVLLAFALLAFLLPTSGDQLSSGRPDCAEFASSIAQKTGANVGSKSSLGDIAIHHPATAEIHLYCTDGVGPAPVLGKGSIDAISIFTRDDQPSEAYLDFVAEAGTVLTGYAQFYVRSEVEECLRAASATKRGIKYRNFGEFGMMCDGGPKWNRAYEVEMEGPFPQSALDLD